MTGKGKKAMGAKSKGGAYSLSRPESNLMQRLQEKALRRAGQKALRNWRKDY